jgi:hypothetical protein
MPQEDVTSAFVTTAYVANDAWTAGRATAGRPDAIDDIADQFERRAAPVASSAELIAGSSGEAFEPAVAWPRASRGWRSMARLHPRSAEREDRRAS